MPDTFTYGECDCSSCRRTRNEEPEYECPECGAPHYSTEEAEACCAEEIYSHYCPRCGEHWGDDENGAINCCRSDNDGAYPPLPELDNIYSLNVPAIPGRPARLCSIEQEITDGGSRVAQLLFDIGISSNAGLAEYSATGRRGQAIVKEDGSLPDAGGEVVYSRFRLDNDDDVRNLSLGLAKTRQLKDADLVSSGKSAGTHIHIAAQCEDGTTFMPQHMASLHELFCHLADTLYALAACGWEAHRLGDEYGGGNTYCKELPEVDGSTTPAKVSKVMRSDRYYGLNFQRLFRAVSSCQCGASLVGDWGACDCGTMESATIEWRLFNSTTKPETIHCWLLLAHALTAYAAQHTLGTLEPNPVRTGTPETRWAQLSWILDNCPFTSRERGLIREAALRSPGFGDVSDTY